ncbi:MAG: helicase, partial [Halodesulfurarchaeum sp.]
LLGQRTGSSVGMDADPYRIELEVPRGIRTNDVLSVLRETDPSHVGPLIELSLKRSETLSFTLSHVAFKFGALKRWEGSDSVSLKRVMAALEDTPIYEEAIREVFQEDLAVSDAESVLESIQSGGISLEVHSGRTPLGVEGRSSGKELLTPENADASVIKTVRERIRNDRVKLVCLHCKNWAQETRIRRVRDRPACPECESTMIAALSPWDDETVIAIRTDEKDEEQERLTRRAFRNASLVQSHGKKAIVALAGRGVGPQNAARIINRHREDEADFYRDILEREREYARTKAFW